MCLQVVVQKSESAQNLIAMIRPLLNCYRKIQSSSIMESLQEGRAFDQRLKALLETRLFKKKINIGMHICCFLFLHHLISEPVCFLLETCVCVDLYRCYTTLDSSISFLNHFLIMTMRNPKSRKFYFISLLFRILFHLKLTFPIFNIFRKCF